MNEATINEMRAKVKAFDEASARKLDLECEIASLETDLENRREIKSLEASVDYNSGYPHRILSRKGLTIGELAAAILPVLRAKLADVQKQLES